MQARIPTLPALTTFALLGALATLGISLGCSRSEAGAPPRPAGEARTVVVELFTSQGCSSCPSADRLLTQLGDDAGDGGVEVIPLSFHVDYWNYIGWTDPFSTAKWSARQRKYGARFAADTVYTPQIVVDGRSDCVGSRRGEVGRQVAAAADLPDAGRVAIHLVGSQSPTARTLAISAELDPATGSAELLVAVFETDLTTEVGSGENARRTLRNDYVVRTLTTAALLHEGQTHETELRIEIDPAWRRDHLGLAVFLQSPETLEIFAAASLRL